jgi:hypothetical protein
LGQDCQTTLFNLATQNAVEHRHSATSSGLVAPIFVGTMFIVTDAFFNRPYSRHP